MKGICPECDEVVRAKQLVFPSTIKKESDEAFYLCATHEVKVGCKESHVVSVPSGTIVETHCRGSMRPPKSLIQEHWPRSPSGELFDTPQTKTIRYIV